MGIIGFLIVIALSIWVASVQIEKRQINGWAYVWCLLLGPLWGWIVIACTVPRREKNVELKTEK